MKTRRRWLRRNSRKARKRRAFREAREGRMEENGSVRAREKIFAKIQETQAVRDRKRHRTRRRPLPSEIKDPIEVLADSRKRFEDFTREEKLRHLLDRRFANAIERSSVSWSKILVMSKEELAEIRGLGRVGVKQIIDIRNDFSLER